MLWSWFLHRSSTPILHHLHYWCLLPPRVSAEADAFLLKQFLISRFENTCNIVMSQFIQWGQCKNEFGEYFWVVVASYIFHNRNSTYLTICREVAAIANNNKSWMWWIGPIMLVPVSVAYWHTHFLKTWRLSFYCNCCYNKGCDVLMEIQWKWKSFLLMYIITQSFISIEFHPQK